MKNIIPENPHARRRLLKKVLIGAGVVGGVAAAVIIVRRLGSIEVELEQIVDISTDALEAVEQLADPVTSLV